jgi:hypothetical protein
MKMKAISLAAILGLGIALAASPADAQSAASVTGAGAATLPAGASFSGVPLTGLRFGMGVNVASAAATGDFQATLLGTVAGRPRNIVVEGKPATGSLPGANTVSFSGVSTVDMGDGTPPLLGVPFAVTAVKGTSGKGTLALTLFTTSLPVATIDAGGLTIR